MPHLTQRLSLDLSNPFAGDPKLTPDLFQGPTVAINQAETLFEHLTLAFGQSFEYVLDLLLQQNDGGHIARIFGALIFDEVAKIGFLAFANRRLERDRL